MSTFLFHFLSHRSSPGLRKVLSYAHFWAAKAVVKRNVATPDSHCCRRPHPFQPLVALALSGRPGAAARWHAALGPPDPAVARRSEPRSLHALLPLGDAADRHSQPATSPSGAGAAAAGQANKAAAVGAGATGSGAMQQPAFACSYGTRSAAFDLALLFHQALDSSGSAPQSQGYAGLLPLSPKSPPPAAVSVPSSAAPSAVGAGAVGGLAGGTGGLQWLSLPSQQQSQWVALPAGCVAELLHALWLLQHLAWCGFALRTLLRAPAPVAVLAASSAALPAAASDSKAGPPVLLVELSKDECRQQLRAAVSDAQLPPLLVAAGGGTDGDVVPAGDLLLCGGGSVAQSSALAAEAARVCGQLPSIPSAQQLLSATQHLRAALVSTSGAGVSLTSSSGRDGSEALDAGEGAVAAAKGVDRLVCVALQGRNTQELLLLVLELLRQGGALGATPGAAVAAATPQTATGAPGLELVALRLVRQLPHEASLHLNPVLAAPGSSSHAVGAAAAAASGRPKPSHGLRPGQPCLILALNGPNAAAALERGLASLSGLASGAPGPRRPSASGNDASLASSNAFGPRANLGSGGSTVGMGAATTAAWLPTLQQLLGVEAVKAYSSSLGQGSLAGMPAAAGAGGLSGGQAQAPLVTAQTMTVGAARAVLAYCFHPQHVSRGCCRGGAGG